MRSSSLFFIPGDEKESLLNYKGQLDGWIAVLEVERAAVRLAVPNFLDLMDPSEIPEALRPRDGFHPVIFMAGRFYGLQPSIPIPRLLNNFTYLESSTVVPFVKGCGAGPKNYPVCLQLEDPRAVALGWVGAINKVFANLEMNESGFMIDEFLDAPGTPLLQLQETERRPLTTDPTHLTALRDVFRNPLIGSYTDMIKRTLKLEDIIKIAITQVCETMDFDLGTELYATDLDLEIATKFDGPLGESRKVPGIDKSAFGAFWMKGCNWRLDAPGLC